MAERQQRYKLAYALVHNAKDRYSDAIDLTTHQLTEALLLAQHLERPWTPNGLSHINLWV